MKKLHLSPSAIAHSIVFPRGLGFVEVEVFEVVRFFVSINYAAKIDYVKASCCRAMTDHVPIVYGNLLINE